MSIGLNRFLRRIATIFGKPVKVNPVLAPFPPMVMIDTTTRCNLACCHCPNRHLKEKPGFIGDMTVELYSKIIDEIAHESPHTVVRPFDGGEPLMRKDIEVLIRYAKDKGIRHVSINSNGLLLTRERSIALLESGLDSIEISIDAATESTYRNIRGSGGYNILLDNVHQLLALRSELNSNLQVTVSFVRQQINRSETELFLELWAQKTDRVYIRECHQHNNLIKEESGTREKRRGNRHPCPYLWDRLIVHHNGKVRFCESDWECSHSIGDLSHQSIKEIWNSERYYRLRKSHLCGDFDHSFCKNCSDWHVVTW